MQLHKLLGNEDKDLVNEEENEEKIYKKPKIVDKQIETTSKENNIENRMVIFLIIPATLVKFL